MYIIYNIIFMDFTEVRDIGNKLLTRVVCIINNCQLSMNRILVRQPVSYFYILSNEEKI